MNRQLVEDLSKHARDKMRVILADAMDLLEDDQDKLMMAIFSSSTGLGQAAAILTRIEGRRGRKLTMDQAFTTVLHLVHVVLTKPDELNEIMQRTRRGK